MEIEKGNKCPLFWENKGQFGDQPVIGFRLCNSQGSQQLGTQFADPRGQEIK